MNRTTKAAVTAVATGALVIGGAPIASASDSNDPCPAGQELVNAADGSGNKECGTVTTGSASGSGRPTVNDLMFRDENAVPTGSGMNASAHFTTTGSTIKRNGVEYIEVVQKQEPGTQGYGPLYRGYVTKQFTKLGG